jgi:hypothetical protein
MIARYVTLHFQKNNDNREESLGFARLNYRDLVGWARLAISSRAAEYIAHKGADTVSPEVLPALED